MNHYKTSTGERIGKSEIDRRIREAKEKKLNLQLEEHGYNFCEDCGRSGGEYLDCSHVVSVKKCQDEGMVELAYDVGNIRVLCRPCHQRHDKNGVQFKN